MEVSPAHGDRPCGNPVCRPLRVRSRTGGPCAPFRPGRRFPLAVFDPIHPAEGDTMLPAGGTRTTGAGRGGAGGRAAPAPPLLPPRSTARMSRGRMDGA